MIDIKYLKNIKLIRWLHLIAKANLIISSIFLGLSILIYLINISTQDSIYSYWFFYLMTINIIVCSALMIYCNLSAKYNNYSYNSWKTLDGFKIALLTIMILSLVYFLFVMYEIMSGIRYPVIYDIDYLQKQVFFISLPFIISSVGLLLKILLEKLTKKEIFHIILTVITFVLIAIAISLSLGFSIMAVFGGVYESETSDIKNYKKFDSYVEMDQGIKKLLPEEVPQSAEDISYYYRHAYCIDPDYDIYAEWTLPEDEYLKEKERVMSLFEEQDRKDLDKEDEYTSYVIGADDSNFKSHYYYLIFEYSDETNSVRYICSYCMDNAVDMTPYFMKIN